MNEIKKDGKTFAIFGDVYEVENGATFIGSSKEMLQFAVFRYGKDKILQNHIHKYRRRIIERTQESMIVFKGIARAFIFDEDKNIIHEQTMTVGQFVICYRGGHGFEVLEDNTLIIENKLGDFIGIEEDKEKF